MGGEPARFITIDPSNQIAIATLVRLLQDSESIHICLHAARSLAKIGAGDESAIASLIQLIQTFNENKYEGCLECVANRSGMSRSRKSLLNNLE